VLLVRGSCIPGEVHVEMKRLGYPPLTLLGGAAALGNGVAGLPALHARARRPARARCHADDDRGPAAAPGTSRW
jgi:hypothetical protein